MTLKRTGICQAFESVKDELKDDLLIIMRVYFEKPRHHSGLERLD